MRLMLIVSSLLLVLAPMSSAGDGQPPDSDGRLVVHEWGTFTNFSGSDGVKLEFRPLVDNDLPDFVLDRAWQAGVNRTGFKAFVRGRLRMETPVTYFYTDRVRKVDVRVGFPQGLLTEFYPPVKSMMPAFAQDQFTMLPALENSELDWGTVTLIPESQLRTHIDDEDVAAAINAEVHRRLIPDVGHSQHYGYARETDSAIVHVHVDPDSTRPRMPFGDFFEKFLFYRGVGNFELPLQLTCHGEERFDLVNNGSETVRSLFLVSVHNGELRFQAYDSIKAGGTLSMTQSGRVSSVEELGRAVVEALIAEGLFEKEALSMVKTWSESWFGEEGTRLFYMVPPCVTDELLPLNINPAPDEIVRVLVGRMEIMSPEVEAAIEQLVHQSRQIRAAYEQHANELRDRNEKVPPFRMPAEILSMGRLAEPALVRVIGTSDDINVRREGRLLLRQWLQELSPKIDVTAVLPE